MFGLLTRARRVPAAAVRPRLRLCVEQLEARECLSAPSITSFSIVATTGHNVQITGHVTDDNPASVQVNFGGIVSGSTMANASGDFSLATAASSLGAAYAVARDGQGLTSAQATAILSVAAPTITVNPYNEGEFWTFSGHVTDGQNPQNLVVTLNGLRDVQGKTATVDANGNYTITIELPPGETGTVTATVSDAWNQVSSATTLVT
jgi:hypothetical protein